MIYLFFILLLYIIATGEKTIQVLNDTITVLKIQLKNEKEKNDKLSNLIPGGNNNITILTNELNDEKNKNKNLSKENMNLNKKLEELKLALEQKNSQGAKNYSNQNQIIELYEKIDNLNEKLKRYPIELEKNEKLISIIFASSDQAIYYSMICKNTDTISDLEKQLYKEYPDFIETDNFFLCKGSVINKYKSLESYKIKNGDILILNKREG